MKCKRCKTAGAKDVLFCRNCGIPFHGNVGIECENHPDRDASGICVVCGKPVCDDCTTTKEGKSYCEDASHAQLLTTHVKLASAISVSAAELLARNLTANGVAALFFSQHQYSHFYRFTDGPPALLYVPKGKVDTAHQLLLEMDLTDFLNHNKTL